MTDTRSAPVSDIGAGIGHAGSIESWTAPAAPAGPLSSPREASIWARLRLRHFTPSGTGVGVAVPAGSVSLDIVFARAESNTDYGVLIVPNWDTSSFITDKTTTGFTVSFGAAPGSDTTLQWATHRSEDS
jgi:hypothetical protein